MLFNRASRPSCILVNAKRRIVPIASRADAVPPPSAAQVWPFCIQMGAHGTHAACCALQVSAQEIFVPFPAATHAAVVTLYDAGVAVSAVEVTLEREQFELTLADGTLDPLALVPGATVTIPIRCTPAPHPCMLRPADRSGVLPGRGACVSQASAPREPRQSTHAAATNHSR